MPSGMGIKQTSYLEQTKIFTENHNESNYRVVEPSSSVSICKTNPTPMGSENIAKEGSQNIRQHYMRLSTNTDRSCTHGVFPTRLPKHRMNWVNKNRHANMDGERQGDFNPKQRMTAN